MNKLLSIATLVLIAFSQPAFGGMPEPPPQFSKIFSNVSILESSITQGDWQVAEEKGRVIQELLGEIAPQIKKTAGPTKYDHLVNSLYNLKEVLRSKDSSVVFDQLLLVEKLLFQTMENFNYTVLPAILVINEHINEAIEAVDRADYERIFHEMDEIAIIFDDSTEKLVSQGIGEGMQSDMLAFRNLIITATENQDQAKIAAELKQMKTLSRAFIWMARQN